MPLGAGQVPDASDYATIAAASNKKPLVRLVQAAAQSIANNTTTALTFGTGSEDIDTDGYHSESSSNTRVTPTRAGIYKATVTTAFAPSAAQTAVDAMVGKNGSITQPQVRLSPGTSNIAKAQMASALISINGTGDYIEGFARQISSPSASLNTQVGSGFNSVLEVEFIRDLA